MIDCVWNVMAHAQKPDILFRRNGRVHLNRRGASVQSTAGSWGVRISCSNAGYTMFGSSAKSTGYPLHSPVSPSLPPPVRYHVPSHFNWSLHTFLYIVYVHNIVYSIRGLGSLVGIATDYGLEGPGSNLSGDEIFRPSRLVLGPTKPPVKFVPFLSRG